MALAACSHTHFVHAVSLGKFELKSDRGQALSAELEIAAAKEDELRTLKIGIAPAQTYRQHWLELHPEIVGTKFILKRNAQGRYVVQIQGSEPISRPWLDLLLVVSWNDQQRIHEYSVRFPSADSTPDLASALAKLPAVSKLPDPKSSTAGRIEAEAPRPETAAVPSVAGANLADPAQAAGVAMAAAVQTETRAAQEPVSQNASDASEKTKPETESTGSARMAVQDVPFSDPSVPVSDAQASSLDDMVRIFSATRLPPESSSSLVAAEKEETTTKAPSSEQASTAAKEADKPRPTPSVQIDKETFGTYKQLLAHNPAKESAGLDSAQQLQGKIRIETPKRGAQSSRLALSSPNDQKMAALALREQELENAAIVSSMQKNIDDIKNLQAQATSDVGATALPASETTTPSSTGASHGASGIEGTALPVPIANPSSDQPVPIVSSGIPNDGGMFGRFKSEIRSVLFAAFIVFIPIFFLFKSAQSIEQTRRKKGSDKNKSGFQNLSSALRLRRKREDSESAPIKQKKTSHSTHIPTVTDRVGGLDLNLDTPSSSSQAPKAP